MSFKSDQKRILIQTATSASMPPEPPRPKVAFEEPNKLDFPAEALKKYPTKAWVHSWLRYRHVASVDIDLAQLDQYAEQRWVFCRRDGSVSAPSSETPVIDGHNINSYWRRWDCILGAMRREDYEARQHAEWLRRKEQLAELSEAHRDEARRHGADVVEDANSITLPGQR